MPKRKKVLLIGLDAWAAPLVERLVGEAALFENNFCVSPPCSPARGCIMTGKLDQRSESSSSWK